METERQFETNKNLKALGITCAIIVAVFLLFFLVGWTLPKLPPEPKDEGVEVNLGNSDFGSGNIAPQAPGEPTDVSQNTSTPPPTASATPATEKEVIPNNDPDATPVNTSPKPKEKPHKEIIEPKVKPAKTKTVEDPKPKPEKIRAVMPGGKSHSAGGNDQDTYKKSTGQGDDKRGNADKGSPNGNINSNNYGPGGGSGNGISIRSGLSGRSFIRLPSFTDNFNENAKVAVDITVDKNGNVTAADINLRGTTTTNQDIWNIATKKAKLLKLTPGDAEQNGTILFNFKLQ